MRRFTRARTQTPLGYGSPRTRVRYRRGGGRRRGRASWRRRRPWRSVGWQERRARPGLGGCACIYIRGDADHELAACLPLLIAVRPLPCSDPLPFPLTRRTRHTDPRGFDASWRAGRIVSEAAAVRHHLPEKTKSVVGLH